MLKKWIKQAIEVNQRGPDGGTGLLDYELPNVGRVVIEKKSREKKPKEFFAVTVAVYGRFLNTTYYESYEDACEHANATKLLIQTAYEEQK